MKGLIFKKIVTRIFTKLKNEKQEKTCSPVIPIYSHGSLVGLLRVASKNTLENPLEIENLAHWRKKNEEWFFAQFTISSRGTRTWFDKQVLRKKDRLLFMVETPSGIPFGHIGLYRFNFLEGSCEIDNVVRGDSIIPGAMTPALKTLIDWAFTFLHVETLYLRTFADNEKAIALYKRCGFRKIQRIPLIKTISVDITNWLPLQKGASAERYELRMMLKR